MTKKQAENQILSNKIFTVKDWDHSEDEYCRQWFGRDYLGCGMIRCDYCKDNAVEFRGYISGHVCAECQKDLENLEGYNEQRTSHRR